MFLLSNVTMILERWCAHLDAWPQAVTLYRFDVDEHLQLAEVHLHAAFRDPADAEAVADALTLDATDVDGLYSRTLLVDGHRCLISISAVEPAGSPGLRVV